MVYCQHECFLKYTLHESHFRLGFTSGKLLSAVLSNSLYVITSCNFSTSYLTLWFCRRYLFMEWCTLTFLLTNVSQCFVLGKKWWISKISSCISQKITSFGKYLVKFSNLVCSDLTVFVSVSVKNRVAVINLLSSEQIQKHSDICSWNSGLLETTSHSFS